MTVSKILEKFREIRTVFPPDEMCFVIAFFLQFRANLARIRTELGQQNLAATLRDELLMKIVENLIAAGRNLEFTKSAQRTWQHSGNTALPKLD